MKMIGDITERTLMRRARPSFRHLAFGVALAAVLLTGCVQATTQTVQRPRTLALGEDLDGASCIATSIEDRDPAMRNNFSNASYVVNCRGVSAAAAVGHIRLIERTEEAMSRLNGVVLCGPAAPVTQQTRAGAARLSRCYDTTLGAAELVRIDVDLGNFVLVGTAREDSIGTIETGMALLSGELAPDAVPDGPQVSSIDAAQLARPSAEQLARASVGVRQISQLEIVRRQGVELNRSGRFVEASRVLNDALSRIEPGDDPLLRADLLLEAGLADSNIQYFQSADSHFEAAENLLNNGVGDPFTARKLVIYRTLNAINRGEAGEVSEATPAQPLLNMSLIADLAHAGSSGRAGTPDIAGRLGATDTGVLNQLFLDTQEDFARVRVAIQTAHYDDALNRLAETEATLADMAALQLSSSAQAYLESRILLQRARALGGQSQFAAAIEALNTAEERLSAGVERSQASIAQIRLERANYFAQTDAAVDAKRAEYAQAMRLYESTNEVGGLLPASADRYFSLLINEAARAPNDAISAEFFAAIQAAGERGTARQLGDLIDQAGEDAEVVSLRRQIIDVGSELTGHRYRIAQAALTGAETEEETNLRDAAEARLTALRARLSRNANFAALDVQPVRLEELRRSLHEGEGYLKIVELTTQIVGIYVTRESTHIYFVAQNTEEKRQIMASANALRFSIDGVYKASLARGRTQIGPYHAGDAFILFNQAAGPSASRAAILGTRSIIVEANGPFENIPFSALVTSFNQATAAEHQRYIRQRNFRDVRHLDFVAERMAVTTSLSPRLFLLSRTRAATTASRPFLGFGTHVQPGPGTYSGDRALGIRRCSIPYQTLASILNGTPPIDNTELNRAAEILGFGESTVVTAGNFTDTAISGRDDLSQYKVLHFATHGVTEGQFGCPTSPPGLLTSIGSGTSDALLSFDEISRLRLDANLVVLSACDTATGVTEGTARAAGQEDSGSTLSGLVRAFFVARSRAVMATYWTASNEQSTVQFMERFYTSAREKPMADALHDAQAVLIESRQYSHPFYWAPFVLIGDGSKQLLAGGAARVADDVHSPRAPVRTTMGTQ